MAANKRQPVTKVNPPGVYGGIVSCALARDEPLPEAYRADETGRKRGSTRDIEEFEAASWEFYKDALSRSVTLEECKIPKLLSHYRSPKSGMDIEQFWHHIVRSSMKRWIQRARRVKVNKAG